MNGIEKTISDQKKLIRGNSDESYKLKFILEDGSQKEMSTNSSCFETTLGVNHLSLNRDGRKEGCIYLGECMSKSSIYGLRSILQFSVYIQAVWTIYR